MFTRGEYGLTTIMTDVVSDPALCCNRNKEFYNYNRKVCSP